jgi:uncharacterized protein YfaS (alpha-2-macroglobulin family)
MSTINLRPWLAAAFGVVLSLCASAYAEVQMPAGVEADASAWVAALRRTTPGSVHERAAAEDTASAAAARGDFAAAATALERRVGMGDVTADNFLDLAKAYAARTPHDFRKSLLAASAALQRVLYSPDPDHRKAPLLAVITALRGLGRDVDALALAQALNEAAPDDRAAVVLLADLRRKVGLVAVRAHVDGEADPPRACVEFTAPPSHRGDFQPQDWVTLDPPVPAAAVTREGDRICISGLPSSKITRIIIHAGMPGEGGLKIAADTTIAAAVPKRQPRIDFDTRMFVLPRGQAPAVGLTTVNVSSVALRLVRLTERNIPTFLQRSRLGEALSTYSADDIADNTGREVWSGKASIPNWQADKTIRTALPIPAEAANAGPGLYALTATNGDGTPNGGQGSVQMLLVTDIAPTVWRGSDGLTVQTRSYSTAAPRPGIRLVLLARNNDILAETVTDTDGAGRFAAALLRGEGPLAPAVVHAFGEGDDFAVLDLTTAAFDLSDRGVEGMAHPGPLDAFVWTDRGIYRPGETVHISALLRDAAGAPVAIPVHVTVKRPNGQSFRDSVPERVAEAAIEVPVTLSAGAAAGTWTVDVHADPALPPIGHAEFKVDTFTPDRLAVEPDAPPAQIVPGGTKPLPVHVRFLYGSPAARMAVGATVRLVPDETPFPALAGWRVGVQGEAYAAEERVVAMLPTDAAGRTELGFDIGRIPDTTMPLRAAFDITASDPAGRGAHARLEIPVRPSNPLIGVRPGFSGDAIDDGAEAAFDVVAFAPDGTRRAMKARVRLVREVPDWRMVSGRSGLAGYETVWKDQPVEQRDVEILADRALRYARRLDFGRYRIEVAELGGMAVTTYRFRSGWGASESPDVPDRVDVTTARQAVPVGGVARVHVAPPFAGQATVLVLSDRVLAMRSMEMPVSGADVDIPVSADWGPGAYVSVHMFRPGAGAGRPGRAIGLAWVATDASARRLDLAIDAPRLRTPRGTTEAAVHAPPGAWVSLAAVDEGILRLTRYATPDPAAHFLGRRRLGVDIRDDWGRLIAPPDGTATVLRQGGDESGMMPRDDPDRTVSLFFPPVQAGADGIARFPIAIGDFTGEVRLMAVAWQDRRIGSAGAAMTVRDPLVAELLVPAHLAPGDTARASMMLHDLDLPTGDVTVDLSATGGVEIAGVTHFALQLAPGERAMPTTAIRGAGYGAGTVRIAVTGPNGFQVTHEERISVRSARAIRTIVAGSEMQPGTGTTLNPDLSLFLAGTTRATASLGGAVRYDAAALTRALDAYPFACLEQVVSRALPLAVLPDGPAAGPDRGLRLQQAVDAVLDRQRYDGAFALWRAGGAAEPWLTPYAVEFLLRARKAGASVAEAPLAAAVKYMSDEAATAYATTQEAKAQNAYRLYALAMAGQGRPGAARVLAENPAELPTQMARAQVAAALAMAGDTARAEALFTAALDVVNRAWWSEDYGSALRDQAAVAVMLRESGLLPSRLADVAARLPGANLAVGGLNTQEQAWLVAAAAVLDDGQVPVAATLDGAPLASVARVSVSLGATQAVLRNVGDAAFWTTVSVTGILRSGQAAASSHMTLRQRFFAADGSPLNPRDIRQNATFTMVLEAREPDAVAGATASVVQGLPGGWEIAGRFGDGEVAAMPWLGTLSHADAQPASGERFAAIGRVDAEDHVFRVAVRLRAVSLGDFELPGAQAADMYRPDVSAALADGRALVSLASP